MSRGRRWRQRFRRWGGVAVRGRSCDRFGGWADSRGGFRLRRRQGGGSDEGGHSRGPCWVGLKAAAVRRGLVAGCRGSRRTVRRRSAWRYGACWLSPVTQVPGRAARRLSASSPKASRTGLRPRRSCAYRQRSTIKECLLPRRQNVLFAGSCAASLHALMHTSRVMPFHEQCRATLKYVFNQ